jgi:hypothetical protein
VFHLETSGGDGEEGTCIVKHNKPQQSLRRCEPDQVLRV